MSKKQKLELTWIGKDQRPKLEPRILIEDPEKSYHAKERVSKNDIFDNMLIHGDNLLALKALEQEYAGKVKCVYIDPPFNTGQAFDHYEDGIEHSLWLSLMADRLRLLQKLLSENGTIWVHLDDNEVHYLRVLMDEIFGRENFVSSVVWRAADSSNNDAKQFSVDHNIILVYSKTPGWLSNALPRSAESNKHYKNTDNDPKGPWFQGNLSSPNPRENLRYEIVSPCGNKIKPPANGWRWGKERVAAMIKSGEIVFKDNETKIMRKTYLADQKGLSPSSLWHNIDDTGHNRQVKYELKKLFPDEKTADLFKTPKPEKLIQKILHISTQPGDLVLDSFLGSATTAAVAHKMQRRWIGVELGEHCTSCCLPRLIKVVDGTDHGGITESVNWQGGGGFRYYELGPSLIEEDKWGNPIISKEFDPPKLTQAMCKLEGFDYAPAPDTYWMQGHSSETDFIYVTSQTMSKDSLAKLSDEVGDNRSLLVCCPSFRAKAGDFPNLTLKKIPKAVLKKCEWGRDDYSLQIQDLPAAPVVDAEVDAAAPKKPRRKFGKANDKKQQELF